MRVGLNATVFNDRPSGARQRFLNIYGALIRMRPDWTFVIYEPADCRVATWFGDAPNVVARRTPLRSVGRWQRVVRGAAFWPRAFAADALDRFEDFVLPMVKHPTAPTMLTIHDVRSLEPEDDLLGGFFHRWVYRRAFARADHVIAVSNVVRDEILAFHPSAHVSTVYNGVDPADFVIPPATVSAVRRAHGVADRYILAVGHLEARKNLSLLIEAIARLRDAGIVRPLVIVGNDGGQGNEIRHAVAQRGLVDQVTIIERADDLTVRALYGEGALLAFPSRYEGFGIPILEAMAAKCPMVLADTSVFRELTMGQGLYFPTDDPGKAAEAIERAWNDPDERHRQRVFAESRLPDFAFDHLAQQVAAIHEQLDLGRDRTRGGLQPRNMLIQPDHP